MSGSLHPLPEAQRDSGGGVFPEAQRDRGGGVFPEAQRDRGGGVFPEAQRDRGGGVFPEAPQAKSARGRQTELLPTRLSSTCQGSASRTWRKHRLEGAEHPSRRYHPQSDGHGEHAGQLQHSFYGGYAFLEQTPFPVSPHPIGYFANPNCYHPSWLLPTGHSAGRGPYPRPSSPKPHHQHHASRRARQQARNDLCDDFKSPETSHHSGGDQCQVASQARHDGSSDHQESPQAKQNANEDREEHSQANSCGGGDHRQGPSHRRGLPQAKQDGESVGHGQKSSQAKPRGSADNGQTKRRGGVDHDKKSSQAKHRGSVDKGQAKNRGSLDNGQVKHYSSVDNGQAKHRGSLDNSQAKHHGSLDNGQVKHYSSVDNSQAKHRSNHDDGQKSAQAKRGGSVDQNQASSQAKRCNSTAHGQKSSKAKAKDQIGAGKLQFSSGSEHLKNEDTKQESSDTQTAIDGQTKSKEELHKVWIEHCLRWFPNLHKQTYFVPDVYFNKVAYDVSGVEDTGEEVLVPKKATNEGKTKAGSECKDPTDSTSTDQSREIFSHQQQAHEPIRGMWSTQKSPLKPKQVFDCDVRENRAQQRVLRCIRALAEKGKEVMMVLSDLNYKKYLDGYCSPVSAAAAVFPTPATLTPEYQRGDFDILILHAKYGIIVAEVKSVGADTAALPKRVEKAIGQLNKAEVVLKHIVSDLPHLNVTKTLILPNITTAQLEKILIPELDGKLCRCLGAPNRKTALLKCLCSDQLPPSESPWEISDSILDALGEWWQITVVTSNPDDAVEPSVYEQLIARFCGPATTVEVFTVTSCRLAPKCKGEAVAETGRRMTQLALFQDQMELLNRRPSPPRAFLTGPPGTGKSIMLALKSLQWLGQDRDVQLLNVWKLGRAAFYLLHHQIVETFKARKSAKKTKAKVVAHTYDFKNNEGDLEKAVRDLVEIASKAGGKLFVIVDEAGPEHGIGEHNEFKTFCRRLVEEIPKACIWAASSQHMLRPLCLSEERLTHALRCPPVVIREVCQCSQIETGYVYGYSTQPELPAPTDGPGVTWLRHSGEVGHSKGEPEDCDQCGYSIATYLNEDLNFNPNRKGALQYRDVLILCNNPHDEEKNERGEVTVHASRLIQGLRFYNFPVKVVRSCDSDDVIRRMVLAEDDVVTVADCGAIAGLERSVVIGMGTPLYDWWYNRLNAMTRSSAQLAWIDRSTVSKTPGK